MRTRTIGAVLAGAVLASAATLVPHPAAAAPRLAGIPKTVMAVPGDGFVEVSWATSGNQSGVLGYRITQYDGGSSTPTRTVDTDSGLVRRRFYGLDEAKTYRFTVSVREAGGPGAPSAATAPVGPAALWPHTTADAMAQQQSLDFLGRAATSAEVAAARTALGGSTSAGAYALGVSRSSEAKPLAAMARLYIAYFKRPPDPSGYAYWVGKLRARTSIEVASSTFAGSSEFKRTYGTLTNRQFVDLVYRNVLGRGPDAAGLSYWTGQLDKKKRARGAVMTQFSESSENLRKRAEEVDTVVLRFGLLRTTPTVAQYDATVARIEGGTPAATIASELYATEAYRARFGRQTGAPIQAPGTLRTLHWPNLSPSTTVLHPSGRFAYALNTRSDSVDVFDVLDNRVVATIPTSPTVRNLAISPDGSRLYFNAAENRDLEVYDTATLEPLTPIHFAEPEWPQAYIPLADGRLIVAVYDGDHTDIVGLDPATGTRTVYLEDEGSPVIGATGDLSHVAISTGSGVRILDVATGSLTPQRYLSGSVSGPIRPWGDHGFIVSRATLVDEGGNLVSDIPDSFSRSPMAADPAGARGYRFDGNFFQVVDLARGISNRRIEVPDYGPTISAEDVDVSADGRTVVSTMSQGMVVVGAPTTLSPEPVPAERAPFSPFVPTAGKNEYTRVSDLKIAPDSATVWAVNQGLNQVEVLDAVTRDRLKVIKLGSVPSAIDFSPDGARAYVVGPGSALVTVIDTATRSVHHTFPLPATSGFFQPPERIAATADGRLLVSRRVNPDSSPGSYAVSTIDVATEAEVTTVAKPVQADPFRLAVSGDRTKVLIPLAANGSTAVWYDSATGTFSSTVTKATRTFDGSAVDHDGDRVFGGRRVLDGDLAIIGLVETPQPIPYLAGISASGTVGYRWESGTLRVLDLVGFTALRGVSTGDLTADDQVSDQGAVAVSPDGHVVAVITQGGLSILRDP